MVRGSSIRSSLRSIHFILAVLISILLALTFYRLQPQAAEAATDTCTWTGGGADADITTAGNWTGCDNGGVPENFDELVFPNGPTDKAVNFDDYLEFAQITFSGDGYTVTSSDSSIEIVIDSGLTISGDNNTINAFMRFVVAGALTFTHSGNGTDIADTIGIQPLSDDIDITFDIDSDLTVPMIAQTAPGAGSTMDTFTKTGTGKLELTGAPISGIDADEGVYIKEGAWQCDSTHCLGDSSNEIILDEDGDEEGSELRLNAAATFPQAITSAATTGDNGSVIISADATLSGDITVNDSLNMFVSGSHTATINSDIAIDDSETLTSYGANGYTTNNFDYNGEISGDGGLIVDDAHVTLSGTNTYTGTTELQDTGSGAVVSVEDDAGLGATAGETIVNSGNTLEFSNSVDQDVSEPVSVEGTGVGGAYNAALVNTDQYLVSRGNVTLTGDTTIANNSPEAMVLTGRISGSGDLIVTGDADGNGVIFASSTGNNYVGDTTVTATRLFLEDEANVGQIPGDVTVTPALSQTTQLALSEDNQVANDSVIDLNGAAAGLIVQSGVSDMVGSIIGTGTISMLANDALINVGGGNTNGTFSGVLEGYTDSMFQIVDGVWTFAGRSEDVGDGYSSFYVDGGTFVADASDTSLGLSPFSISSGVLGGTGIIGGISVYGGNISPGNSPGCLYPAGDVAFTDPGSILNVEINGKTACSGYDVLNAAGTVYLNDATLNVDLGFDSVKGDVFTIVRGGAIDGTFNGLADGDTVTADGHTFRINYSATTVTLTDITSQTAMASEDLASTGINSLLILFAGLLLITSGGALGLRQQLGSVTYSFKR